jgi:hypothetical protein
LRFPRQFLPPDDSFENWNQKQDRELRGDHGAHDDAGERPLRLRSDAHGDGRRQQAQRLVNKWPSLERMFLNSRHIVIIKLVGPPT